MSPIQTLCLVLVTYQLALVWITRRRSASPGLIVLVGTTFLVYFNVVWQPADQMIRTPATEILSRYDAVARDSVAVLLTTVALAAGTATLVTISRHSPALAPQSSELNLDQKINLFRKSAPTIGYIAPWMAILSLSLGIFGVGTQSLLSSERYLEVSGPALLATIGPALMLPAATSLGVLIFNSPAANGHAYRALGCTLLILIMIFLFARGSRALALAPGLALAGGSLLSQESSGKIYVRFRALSIGIACAVLMGVSLTIRASNIGHGLLPYTEYLSENIAVIPMATLSATDNVMFCLPLAGYIADMGIKIPTNSYLVSLNPLPGGMVGWPSVSPSLRIHRFIPFNTIGELGNLSLFAVFTYFFTVVCIFNLINRSLRRLPEKSRTMTQIIFSGLCAMFFIQSLQYNLRSSTRFVYYALVLAAGVHWLARRQRLREDRPFHVSSDRKLRPGLRRKNSVNHAILSVQEAAPGRALSATDQKIG